MYRLYMCRLYKLCKVLRTGDRCEFSSKDHVYSILFKTQGKVQKEHRVEEPRKQGEGLRNRISGQDKAITIAGNCSYNCRCLHWVCIRMNHQHPGMDGVASQWALTLSAELLQLMDSGKGEVHCQGTNRWPTRLHWVVLIYHLSFNLMMKEL